MSDRSAIEWTDATWNPVTGCSKVSRGCEHCYAETLSHRYRGSTPKRGGRLLDGRTWDEYPDPIGARAAVAL